MKIAKACSSIRPFVEHFIREDLGLNQTSEMIEVIKATKPDITFDPNGFRKRFG